MEESSDSSDYLYEYLSEEDVSDDSSTASGEDDSSTHIEIDEHEESVQGDDLNACVEHVCGESCCDKACLSVKTSIVKIFLQSRLRMSKSEQRVSLLTALSVSATVDTFDRKRSSGVRNRFAYYLPVIGEVCRAAFALCYGVSDATITRLRRRIHEGEFAAPNHGGKQNKNAQAVDAEHIVSWFQEFASEAGEIVPIRTRRVIERDGNVAVYYSNVNYTLLPAYFTWKALHDQYRLYVEASLTRRYEPEATSFRNELQEFCRRIQIRSPRDNVCDECVIYKNYARNARTAVQNEGRARDYAVHVEDARVMRYTCTFLRSFWCVALAIILYRFL